MSRSVKTIEFYRDPIIKSGNWSEDFQSIPGIKNVMRTARATGVAIVLGLSSITSSYDSMLVEAERNLITSTAQLSRRRRISLKEARLISLRILKQADSERDSFANIEAKKGIQWSEEV